MDECWAHELGDCSGKITQEHTVTEGVFVTGLIQVHGFKWCKQEPKEIRKEKLTRPILCDGHNNALSFKVDPAGVKFMTAFRAFWEMYQAREEMPPRRWSIQRKTIEGVYLERWFLKSLINMTLDNPHRIGRDSLRAGKPSLRLVRAAFGHEVLRSRAGLYALGHTAQNLVIEDKLRIMTLLDADDVLIGAVFNTHGYRFAIYLEEDGLESVPKLPPFPDEVPSPQQALYHLKALRFMVHDHLSHVLQFNW